MKAGTELGPRVIESVSGLAMHDVAAVLDDPNPIHLSGEAAAAAGLGDRPVNQGPVNIGYILDLLREHGVVRDIRVRLLANVFAGDRAIAAAWVESVQADRDGRFLARCLVWLDIEGSARAVEGTALLELPGA
jgi:acyl dehydratase